MSANIRHSSASVEHYTPPAIIEAARTVLGGIDLDPASSQLANTVVKAKRIFTIDDDGYGRPWAVKTHPEWTGSRVFLNPPGGKMTLPGSGSAPYVNVSAQKAWWFKLASEYVAGRVSTAIFVSFSIELLQTCQVKPPAGLPLPFDFPICFPSRRLAYWKEAFNDAEVVFGQGGPMTKLVESSSPPHSSMLVFLPKIPIHHGDESIGKQVLRFVEVFSTFGRVVVPR